MVAANQNVNGILQGVLDHYGITGESPTVTLSNGQTGYIIEKHPDGRIAKKAGFKYERASARTATPTPGITTMQGVFVVAPSNDPSAPWVNEMANSIEMNPFTGLPQVRYQTLINPGFVIERGTPFSNFKEFVVGLDVTPDGEVIELADLQHVTQAQNTGPVTAATGGALATAEAV